MYGRFGLRDSPRPCLMIELSWATVRLFPIGLRAGTNFDTPPRPCAHRRSRAGRRTCGGGTDRRRRVPGRCDPVKAIEDALRTFAADELIVVTLPDEDAGWLEKG